MAQNYVNIALSYIKQAADAMVKPVIQLNGILAQASQHSLEENNFKNPKVSSPRQFT